MNRNQLSQAAAALGSKGGKVSSPAKAAAARANGAMPCAPGKRRGRPAKAKEEKR